MKGNNDVSIGIQWLARSFDDNLSDATALGMKGNAYEWVSNHYPITR